MFNFVIYIIFLKIKIDFLFIFVFSNMVFETFREIIFDVVYLKMLVKNFKDYFF